MLVTACATEDRPTPTPGSGPRACSWPLALGPRRARAGHRLSCPSFRFWSARRRRPKSLSVPTENGGLRTGKQRLGMRHMESAKREAVAFGKGWQE